MDMAYNVKIKDKDTTASLSVYFLQYLIASEEAMHEGERNKTVISW